MRSKKLLSWLLALCMIVSVCAPAANAAVAGEDVYVPETSADTATQSGTKENSLLLGDRVSGGTTTMRDTPLTNADTATKGAWTAEAKENDHTVNLLTDSDCLEELREAARYYEDDDIVAAFIVLEDEPLSLRYSAIDAVPAGAENTLVAAQNNVIASIERNVLSGEKLNVRYQFTYLTNAITVRTAFGNLDEIAMQQGVKTVFLAPVYEPCTTEESVVAPLTAGSGVTTGVNDVWNKLGYTGAGMKIAIVDTGLDLDHQSFAAAPRLTEDSMTEEDIAAVLEDLNASQLKSGVKASQLYRSEKIPYAFNYVDASLTADHSADDQGYHGTHVAGIAAAYKTEGTDVVGMAPDAQIVVMKVFGSNGGAYTDDLLACIEDAMTLGCDVANLSLGASRGFTSIDPEIDAIYERIADHDIVVTISAGNEGTSSYANNWGTDLNRTSDPDNSTVSSPSTYANATSVASAENAYLMSTYFTVDGTNIAYSDAIGLYSLFAELGSEELEYVMIPGLGEVADYEGLDVDGKIAVVSRGTISFATKLANAEAAGAVGLVVYNNASGSIGMQMTDDEGNLAEGISGFVPAVSISQAAGQFMADAESKTMVISPEMGVVASEDAGQMSYFSSWGATPDLRLLPDVTGIGGNVYSTADDGLYEVMSGTSMSAPQVAGISALILQYIHDKYPTMADADVHDLANALLMSTAEPIVSNVSGVESSPRQQGAGLANAYNALTAEAYLSVDGGRAKAELYDDPDKTGVYTFSFTIHNLSKKNQTYILDGSILTEDAEEIDGELYMAGYDRTLTGSVEFSKPAVSVKPNGTATIDVTITLSEESKTWLDEHYANGGYVEGYIYLDNYYEGGVDLSLPYMGFYGDWTSAPSMDTGFWYDDSFWYDDAEPTSSEYWHVLWTSLGGADWVIGYNPYTGDPADMNPDHFVVSNNADGYLDSITEIYLSLMRNARDVTVTYTNAETGEVYDTEILEYLEKTAYVSAYGQVVPTIYSWYSYDYYDFTDNAGAPLANNTKLTLEITATQDYDRHAQDTTGDTITIPLTIDTEAPQLLALEQSATADGNFITITLSDNVAPTAVFILNGAGTRMLGQYTDFTANEDGTYTVTMDVSGMGTELQMILCDYGVNENAFSLTYTLEDNIPAADKSALYAYRVSDDSYSDDTLYGWVTVGTEDVSIAPQTSDYMEYYAIVAAEYAGGYVFAVDAGYNFLVMVPGLWNRQEICNLGFSVLDMTFDKTTNTMYAIGKDGYGLKLVTIDLLTGETETVATYSSTYDGPWAFAATADGTFYAIKQYNSYFWTFDEEWNLIPAVDAEGNQLQFFTESGAYASPYYSQSMTWSEADSCLYWSYFSYAGEASLYAIDPETMTYTAKPYGNEVELVALLTMEDSLVDYSTCDGTDCPSARFTDVSAEDWFHTGVDYAVLNGYMNGMSETVFAPKTEVTRAMVVTVLYRMAGSPDVTGDHGFTDVGDDWYTDAVCWAAETGIAKGMTETTFCPGNIVTREQLVTFLYRYAKAMGFDTISKFDSLSQFTDAASVQPYAVAAMKWAVGEGLINGMSETVLAPRMGATRGQFATILLRLYNEVTGGYQIPASGLTGLRLSNNDVLLTVGQMDQVKVSPMPWNALLGEISWTSADPTIATVEDGIITGVSGGVTTVTATCGELTATTTVTVVALTGTVYAYNYYGTENAQNWISFELGDVTGGCTGYGTSAVDFLCADYNGHNGYIYGYDGNYQFYRYDLETNEATVVGDPLVGKQVMDMAYDYSTGFMYAITLDANTYTSELCYVNLNNGALVSVGTAYNAYMTLACSTDGELYAMDYAGNLCQLTVIPGDAEYGMPDMVEGTVLVSGLGELYYQQSMCYDHVSGAIVWAYAEYGNIVWIDPETGHTLYLGDPTGTGAFELMGLFMIPETIEALPYTPVESASASNLAVMAGATKAANVTISPLNATNQTIVWSSADPAVATVDENGRVAGVSVGKTTITGILNDEGTKYELSFEVQVLASADNIYGYVLTDLATYNANYWIGIEDKNPGDPETLNYCDYTIYAAEYYDGVVYAYGYDPYDWEANWQYLIIDADTMAIVDQMDLGDDFNYFVYDMTYDYASSTMYAVAGPSETASDLFIVNTRNGQLIPCLETEQFFMSLAAGPDGTLYAMEPSQESYDPMTWSSTFTNAQLYTIDAENGLVEWYADTGAKSNMISSMAFDHDTGNLYWTAIFRQDFFSPISSGLYLIDESTGEAVNLGNIGAAGAQVSGLFVVADEYPDEGELTLRNVLLDKTSMVLSLGETSALQATVLPVALEDVELTWTSTDEAVATVDAGGNVTGVSKGQADIIVTATCGDVVKTAVCNVTVLSETAAFLSYNTAYWGWSSISRKDISRTTLLAEDEDTASAVSALAYVGQTIYGYDVDNGFFSTTESDFTRTYLGTVNKVYDEVNNLYFEIRDLGYDKTSGKLLALGGIYYSYYDEEWDYTEVYEVDGGCRLYEVNLTNGSLTELCTISELSSVRGMTIGDDGVVYIYTAFDDGVYTVSLTDGAVNKLISLQTLSLYGSVEHNQSMAYDSATGTIYLLFTSNGSYYKMININPKSRVITDLGNVGEVYYDDWSWSYVGETFGGLLIKD